MTGRVYLIGAGPGDPGLLTLRGAECLNQCDVVLYDGLSNDALLRHAPGAEHICVGKHGQSRIWTQGEICQEILRHARAGRAVGRLKGGDPAVFARTSEEIHAIRDAGIPFEVIPGITAALAAGSYAGIPVTDRQLASAVALVTGHEEPNKTESALDWDALARFPGTLVVYMGVTTAPQWTAALLDAGKPADTPVAIIRRCSHPDQQTIHCRLDEVVEQLTPTSRLRPPVIVIIGAVTQLAHALNWFESRPLFGQTVLVTRPADQCEELAHPLRELGATVVCQPAIAISPIEDPSELDAVIDTLADYGTIIFSSVNGVRFFFSRLWERGDDVRRLAGLRVAAVGSKTREAIEGYHVRCDVMPDEYEAEALAAALLADSPQRPCVSIRASRGRKILEEVLEAAGVVVRSVVAYEHLDVMQPDDHVVELLETGGIDWVAITSSQSARNLVHWFGDRLRSTRIATLSPITSATVREHGFAVAAEAEPYTMRDLATAIAHASTPLEP